MSMRVKKRNGRGYEEVQFEKITSRIKNLCWGLDPAVNPTLIAQKTIMSLYDGISTELLDTTSADIAESYKLEHPDYTTLAARILISNLHKMTPGRFSECMNVLAKETNLMSVDHMKFINDNSALLDGMIIDSNDYLFDYFGYKTMECSYLNKVEVPEKDSEGNDVYMVIGKNGKKEIVPFEKVQFISRKGKNVPVIMSTRPVYKNGSEYKDSRGRKVPANKVITVDGNLVVPGSVRKLTLKTIAKVMDRPQYLLMRVAIAINLPITTFSSVGKKSENSKHILEDIKKCYKLMSQQYFTHATPTLFNSCAKNQQLNSCFLLGTADSIEEIDKTIDRASRISKGAGGIGIHMSNIRCRNQTIKGTNGKSSGLPRQLKIYNEAANTWDQGGRRKGAFAIYLEPWHGDIMQFLRLKLNQGSESERARDLFYALWIPDLFTYCAKQKYDWSLFSEDTAPGLSEVYDGMTVCADCGYCANKAYGKFMDGVGTSNGYLIDDEVVIPTDDNTDWNTSENRVIAEERTDYSLIEENCTLDGKAARMTSSQYRCYKRTGSHRWTLVDAFTQLYCHYEDEGLAIGTINASETLDAICEMQRESGTPYILHKDHVNRMSNQAGIGTIKSSNLCCEVQQWSSADSYACCTLASINLKKFLIPDIGAKWVFDHDKLHEVTMLVVKNLDMVIDNNNYPVPECIENSTHYRPIGIGVQALADVFAMMRIPFLSDEAAKLDLEIFETMYHAAVTASVQRAKELTVPSKMLEGQLLRDGRFVGFEDSPAARGQLAYKLWSQNQWRIDSPVKNTKIFSGRWDFDALEKMVMEHGMRNSLLLAPMPTVTTSQILGNNESFEPFSSNISTKNTLAGKFTMANIHMIKHLMSLGLWNEKTRIQVMNNNGSLSDIAEIPEDIKQIYLTTWEMKQSEIMKRAAIRQAFVDQSQSLNIHVIDNSNPTLKGVFFLGASLGLKCGSYYTRTQPKGGAMKNNITVLKKLTSAGQKEAEDILFGGEKASEVEKNDTEIVCDMSEGCMMCGS